MKIGAKNNKRGVVMFLDGIDIGLGKVEISDSKMVTNGIEVPIKCIDISSKDNAYTFTFWTQQEYEKFNDLKLNEKTDVLDLIDDYDIDFCSKECGTINSRENTEVYFTKIDKDKYIVNAEIRNLDDCVLGRMKEHKNLKLEAIIDFKEIDPNE